MRIIIAAGGEIGFNLAKELAQQKHDVVMIEKVDEIAEKLSSELNATVIQGDASEQAILEEAGIKDTDILVVTSSREETNLFVSLLAKDLGCKHVIARADTEEYKKVFLRAGIDQIISPGNSTAEQLNAIITQPNVYDLTMLHAEVDLFEYEIEGKNSIVGKKYHESLTPKDSLIIAVRRNQKFFIPDSNTTFRVGDKLIIIAKKNAMDALKKSLKE